VYNSKIHDSNSIPMIPLWLWWVGTHKILRNVNVRRDGSTMPERHVCEKNINKNIDKISKFGNKSHDLNYVI